MIINNNKGKSKSQDYSILMNKPKINGYELIGNTTSENLGISIPKKLSELESDTEHLTVTEAEKTKWNSNDPSSVMDYNNLSNKPKLNGVEIEGNKNNCDYHLTYIKDFQDNTAYRTSEQFNDYLQKYNSSEVLPGYRDKVIIPDIYNTGVKTKNEKGESITFIDITTLPQTDGSYTIGEVIKGTGTPLQLFIRDSDLIQFNGLFTKDSIAEEILIENYDFSKVRINSLHGDKYPHKIKVIFKNCYFRGFGGNSMRSGEGLLYTKFENCNFEGGISGSQLDFNYCKFHSDTSDAMNPFCDVFVNNSLVYDLQRKSVPGELHIDGVQIYGKTDSFVENIHFKNTRFSIPGFYFGPENHTYVNGAIMLQLEFCDGKNFSFEDIVADYGGTWEPFFSTSKNGRRSTDILFKNTLMSDYYGEGNGAAIGYNAELNKPQLVELNTLHNLYIGSVWKENGKVYLSCTNTSVKKEKRILTVVTNEGIETFEIKRCPTLQELAKDGKYSHYRYKDMPYDIKIELSIPASRCLYVICYEEDTQIRFMNFTRDRILLPKKQNLNYNIFDNKPTINGQKLEGELKTCQILDNNLGKTLSEGIYDLNLIPDVKNTGLFDESLCINNVTPNISIPEYDNLFFTTSEDGRKIMLDFNWNSHNRKITGKALVENINFKDNYPDGFEFSNLSWHDPQENFYLTFKNCKFNSLILTTVKSIATKTLKINFINCSIEYIREVPGNYNNCLIGINSKITPIVATSYSNFYNCYITKMDYSDNTSVNNYGVKILGKKFVSFEHCRFEIPNLQKENPNTVKAIFRIEDGEQSVNNIVIKNCFLNGGNTYFNCLTLNQQNVDIESNYCGENYNNELYSQDTISIKKPEGTITIKDNSKEIVKKNKRFLKLYISSVWKDEQEKLHFIVTNDSLEDRKLSVYTNNGIQDFIIPKQSLLPQTFEELTIDNEKVIEEEKIDFVVFYDEGYQIRFINYSNDYVEAPKKQDNIKVNNLENQTYVLSPEIFTIFSNPLKTLEISVKENLKENLFEFTTSNTGSNLSIPLNFKWNGGQIPTLEPNKIYQVVLFSGTAYISGGISV